MNRAVPSGGVAGEAERETAELYVRADNAKLTRMERSVDLDWPVTELFAFCSSMEGFLAQFPHKITKHEAPQRKWRKGDVVSFNWRQFVGTTIWTAQIFEYEENVMFADAMVASNASYMKVFEHTHRFEPLGANRTRYTDIIELSTKLGGFVDRVVALPIVSSLFAKRQALLKKAVER